MRLALATLDLFKAFEEASFDVRPFTAVIGPNNAGKSSLLHALAILAQSAQAGGVITAGSEVDLGQDPEALTHSSGRINLSKEGWRLGLRWQDTANGPEDERESPVVIGFEAVLVPRAAVPAPNLRTRASVEVHVNLSSTPRPQVTVEVEGPGPAKPTVQVTNIPNPLNRQLPSDVPGLFGFNLGDFSHHSEMQRILARDPNELTAFVLPIAADLLGHMGQAIGSFRYVGPDRTVDRSRFGIGSAPAQYPRTAQDVVNTLIYNGDVLQRVSERCLAMFGYGVSLQFVPQSQVELVATRPQGRPINIANLGSGMIQLVWIVLQMELSRQQAEALESPYPPVVGIEEPELHLHPRLQPEVARILAEYVRTGCQVICTSQSEHFLMAVLQMVLDGDLHQDDLSVYYVENGRPEHLEVDEQGRLSHGLRGFFEANEAELLRRMEALIDRG